MQRKVRDFIEEYHMIERNDRILAAVSGGADSLCLLLVLNELCKDMGFSLCVVHVEHGIRGEESLRDARFVERLCVEWQIPYRICHCRALEYAGKTKQTLEEAARELRYQLFRETAKEFGANKIAVAHNQNDCAETVLFHLARGTGLRGLCGVPPVRGEIIRPLLCAARQEIEAFLSRKGQEFCEDSTNRETLYTRNKIRHQILPLMTQVNANAVAHMNRTAGFAAEAMELIKNLTEKAYDNYVHMCENGICISQELLAEQSLICKEVLLRALAKEAGSGKDLSGIHVQQLLELFSRQSGKTVKLPYGVRALRTYEGLLLKKGSAEPETRQKRELCVELPVNGCLQVPFYGYKIHTRLLEKFPENEEIPKKLYTKWLDYDKIIGNLLLRTRQAQDYLVIDAGGNRKKLKKYFVDEKIPEYRRDQTLLLTDDTHILWVIGYRMSEDIKVTEHTRRILEIHLDGGEERE